MFTNYLLAAIRSLLRYKVYAFINILGLGIGIASCLLIFLYIDHETGYDNTLSGLDRLYRIETESNIPNRDTLTIAQYVGPAYELLPPDFPEIEAMLRLQPQGGALRKGEETIPETITYSDPEFFQIFDLPLVEGSYDTALKGPSDIVITQEMAKKYLGEAPYLGRELSLNHIYERNHVVSAVVEDLPMNTHLNFDFLLLHDLKVDEASSFGNSTNLQRWNGLPMFVYFKLKQGEQVTRIVDGINDWMDKYFPANISRLVGIKGSELFTPKIIKVSDIHLKSEAANDMKPHGSMTLIVGFSAIAGLILIIAIINFMNLATARATLRAREIAVRKVVGAQRSHLFIQFETEAIFYSTVSLIVALLISYLTLPYFAEYTNREIDFSALFNLQLMAAVLGITLLTGLLAGLYPAFYLSGLRPSEALKSNQSGASGNTKLRSVLVVFQFAISAALIIATCIIFVQTEYSRGRDLGYDKSSKMVIRGLGRPSIRENIDVFTKRVSDISGVSAHHLSNFSPGDFTGAGYSILVPGDTDRLVIFVRNIDDKFMPMYDVRPLAGRLFSEDFGNDRRLANPEVPPTAENPSRSNVVINNMAAQRMGFATPEEAVGKVFYRGENNEVIHTIVGVIPDIHFISPRARLDAELFFYAPDTFNTLVLEYDPAHEEGIGEEIDEIAKEMFPRFTMPRQFMEENLSAQFEGEEVQGVLLSIFAGLAILVACMGLYGLSSFTIHRRTKEIGLRKIMGASAWGIIKMLIKQFSIPVTISNVIAWPLAYYGVSEWLTNYQYRIDLPVWFTVMAAVGLLVTLMIAWVTVLRHAWRVANTNPVKALRYE